MRAARRPETIAAHERVVHPGVTPSGHATDGRRARGPGRGRPHDGDRCRRVRVRLLRAAVPAAPDRHRPLRRRVPHPGDAGAPVQPGRHRRAGADGRPAAGVGLRQAEAVRVDARAGDVPLDDGRHQQRRARRAARDGLPRVPDADVAGVRARPVRRVRDRPPADAPRVDARRPGLRDLRGRRCDCPGGADMRRSHATARGVGGGVPRRLSLPRDGRPRRAARVGVRAPRRAGRGLPRLLRRKPLRDVAGRGAPAAAARDRLRQPALGQPDLVGRHGARGAGARGRAALLRRAGERVRVHLHRQRERRAAARRRGLSVRAGAAGSWRPPTTTTR